MLRVSFRVKLQYSFPALKVKQYYSLCCHSSGFQWISLVERKKKCRRAQSLFLSVSVCLSSSLSFPVFLLSFSPCVFQRFVHRGFLTAVDQTERIRVWIGSRNNDEYINHAKSESVCHVYGHCGDGIYQSLSCSARIIRYATSQSFGGEKGMVKDEQTITQVCLFVFCSLCLHLLLMCKA